MLNSERDVIPGFDASSCLCYTVLEWSRRSASMANISYSIDAPPHFPTMRLSHSRRWHQRRTVYKGAQKSLRLAGLIYLGLQMPTDRRLEPELVARLPGESPPGGGAR